MQQFWPLDFFVALLYLAFAIFTGYRGVSKLITYVKQLDATIPSLPLSRRLLLVSEKDNSSSRGTSETGEGSLMRHAGSPSTSHHRTTWWTRVKAILDDRRVATIVLLLVISLYSVSRVIYLLLGAVDVIALDGSLQSNFDSEIPALLFMIIQTALITKWGIHARDCEWLLYARNFTLYIPFVVFSGTVAVAELVVCIVALIDYNTNILEVDESAWNEAISAAAGAVYVVNGTIFVFLGLRLFLMWRASAVGETTAASSANADSGVARTALRNGLDEQDGLTTSLSGTTTCFCLGGQLGSRGYRILGVAFGFGSLLLFRGVGLLSYLLPTVHSANHNSYAPPLALLFEILCLFVTLRLLMPPGKADGEESDLPIAHIGSSVMPPVGRSASSIAAPNVRVAVQRPVQPWARAHALDESNGSPSTSWRFAPDPEEDSMAHDPGTPEDHDESPLSTQQPLHDG